MEIYQLVLIAFWKVVKRRIEAGTYVHESPIRLAIGIARRVIRNAKRTHRRKACQSLPNELAAVGDVATICDEDFKRHLIAAFATLTPIQRRVVDAYLAYVDQSGKLRGGRYQQMADDLGLRPDVVRSIFRRGIAKIRWYFQFAAKHRA
jgi:DNA-directed RNA polymerase specialized sigma24 family protein